MKNINNKWKPLEDIKWIKTVNDHTFDIITAEVVDCNEENNIGIKRLVVDTHDIAIHEIDKYLVGSEYDSVKDLMRFHTFMWEQALAELVVIKDSVIKEYMTMDEFILYIKEQTGMDIENEGGTNNVA